MTTQTQSVLTGETVYVTWAPVAIDPLSEARAYKQAQRELASLRAAWSKARTVRVVGALLSY